MDTPQITHILARTAPNGERFAEVEIDGKRVYATSACGAPDWQIIGMAYAEFEAAEGIPYTWNFIGPVAQ